MNFNFTRQTIKKLLKISLLFWGILAFQQTSVAQCGDDNTQFGTSTVTCDIGLQNLTTCIFGGEYRLVNVTMGNDYVFSTCGDSDFDTQITVYDDATGDFIVYNDDFCGLQSEVSFTAGFTGQVRVLVDRYFCNAESTCMTLQASCVSNVVSNDDCSGAEAIACGDTKTGTTVGMSNDSAPTCGTTNGSGGGVWYTFTGDGGDATLSLCGTGFDTKIRVYTGTCGALVCEVGNDDSCGLQSEVTFTTSSGTDYLVLVHGYSGNEGAYTLNMTCTPPPATLDDCTGAEAIACGDTKTGTTVGMGNDSAPTCGTTNGTGGGVWYTFTGDGGDATLSLCGSGYDTKIRVFTGTCGALVCETGNDDFCGLQSETTFTTTNGTDYLVLVHGYSGNEGAYTLNMTCTPPASTLDDCIGAEAISCGDTKTGTTVGMGNDSAPFCGTPNGSGGGVWYTFTGDGSPVTLSLCGSGYDTKIRAFTGTCGALVCEAGNDDFCGLQSEISFATTIGVDYYVLVHGFGSAEGAYTLSMECCPVIPTLTPGPITVCNDLTGNNTGVYQMQDADDLIRTDPSHTVAYFANVGLTTPINGAVNYTVSNSTTVYAVVSDGPCDSDPVAVTFTISTVTFTESIVHTTCAADNGEYTANASGGDAPYAYYLDGVNMGTTNSYNGLAAGLHTIEILDNNGCTTGVFDFTIDDSIPFVIEAVVTGTMCNEDNGIIFPAMVSGTPSVTYSLDGGPSTSIIPFLYVSAGIHTVSATDGIGCTTSITVNVASSTALEFTASSTASSCGLKNGTIDVNVVSSNGDVLYRIDGVIVEFPLTVSGGTYIIDGSDEEGCLYSTSIYVQESTPLIFDLTSTVPVSCDQENGVVDVDLISSNGNVTYYHYNTEVTFPLTTFSDGTYTFDGVDENGCTYSQTVTIKGSVAFNFTLYTTPTTCGQNNGTLEITPNSDFGPLQIDFAGSTSSSLSRTGLSAGNYWLTITNNAGCEFLSYITILDSDPMSFSVNVTPSQDCGDGFGNVSVSGNSNPNTVWYTIDGYGTNTDGDFECLPVGEYTMEANDYQGCTFSTDFTISSMVTIAADVDIEDATCTDNNDGSATVTAYGGEGPYTYFWNELNVSGDTQNFLSPGLYTVLVTDANLATATIEFWVGFEDVIAPYLTKFSFYAMVSGNFSVANDILPFVVENCGLDYVTANIPDLSAPGTYKMTIVMADINQNIHTIHVLMTVGYGTPGIQSLIGENGDVSFDAEKVSAVLSVYPNPTSGFINIENESFSDDQITINVMDMNGRVILSQTNEFVNGKSTIHLEDANPGIYFVRIVHNDDIYFQKVIKSN